MKSKYREAAEFYFKEKQGPQMCSCYSLFAVTTNPRKICHYYDRNNRYINKYRKYFKPETSLIDGLWFGATSDPENQLARQLALLFMEQIEKDDAKFKGKKK